MKVIFRVLTVVVLIGLVCPAAAQDTYEPLRLPSLHDTMHDYQLPPVQVLPTPSTRDYRIPVPPAPTYQSPPQRDWRDMVDDAMRGFNATPPGHTPESYQMMLDRQDRAMERNHWARCAKYNRFCANMLRSLGN